jgi:hypothetical protein
MADGSAFALPKGNLKEMEYFLNQGDADNMRYFRFEVLRAYDDALESYMQLGEFRFNHYLPW